MTLFESASQYREKAAIWRIFSLLPLFGPLAGGRVWRWFAVNIPMDMGSGGLFTSDIDIIARLHDLPQSKAWLYRTWEVKVSLLCKDGSARSLKVGKFKRTLTQLNAYRDFGSPAVSLLEVYVCESGFMKQHAFPPPMLHRSLMAKIADLRAKQFGYQLLPFEHEQRGDDDVGLFAIPKRWNPLETTFNLLPPQISSPAQPFSRLADRLNEFFEQNKNPQKHRKQIVFCKACRQMQLIRMKDEHGCPNCNDDLICQS